MLFRDAWRGTDDIDRACWNGRALAVQGSRRLTDAAHLWHFGLLFFRPSRILPRRQRFSDPFVHASAANSFPPRHVVLVAASELQYAGRPCPRSRSLEFAIMLGESPELIPPPGDGPAEWRKYFKY